MGRSLPCRATPREEAALTESGVKHSMTFKDCQGEAEKGDDEKEFDKMRIRANKVKA
jgi:hypothetical protein